MNPSRTHPCFAENGSPSRAATVAPWLLASGTLLAATLLGCTRNGSERVETDARTESAATDSDASQRVHTFCGDCHAYPPADIFPRAQWRHEVEQGYMFFDQSGRPLHPPPIEEVVKYYEQRAPAALPPADIKAATHPAPFQFERKGYSFFAGPPNVAPPHVANINLVHLFDPKRLDALVCDMYGGAVLCLQPYLPQPRWRLLYGTGSDHAFNPAHTHVVDLDGDHIADILVANLGSFSPTDRLCGSVLWLRGKGEGRFEPITLLSGVGRVADVRTADFNGDGKLDLIVACFGWNKVGEILYLENATSPGQTPVFKRRQLDDRHGAIHVPVTDLNGDGKPDFVALISQEHEAIVAFLNDGAGNFRKQTLYQAPHPGYGSSGIELVDLNGDGKLDILYTNGDVLDQPYLLKPYHAVQWLQNEGNLRFTHHTLTPLYGAHRAVAADFDGDGDLDIVAVSFLPDQNFPERKDKKADAVVVLEQTSPGVFARHSMETVTCNHVSCAAGDVFASGKQDIVLGNFCSQPVPDAITIWKNRRK
jgi:hypothetical protein